MYLLGQVTEGASNSSFRTRNDQGLTCPRALEVSESSTQRGVAAGRVILRGVGYTGRTSAFNGHATRKK